MDMQQKLKSIALIINIILNCCQLSTQHSSTLIEVGLLPAKENKNKCTWTHVSVTKMYN